MSATTTERVARAIARVTFGRSARPSALSTQARRCRNQCRHWGWEENALGVAVGTKVVKGRRRSTPCVTIYVRTKRATSRLHPRERIPAVLRLEGIGEALTDVVAIGSEFRGDAGELVRPVRPGAQVGHITGIPGTIGVIVKRDDGVVLLTGCSHVLARSGRLVNADDPIEQPFDPDGLAGPNVVARLEPGFSVLRPSGTGANQEDFAAARMVSSPQRAFVGTTITPSSVLEGHQIVAPLAVRLFGSVSHNVRGRVTGGPGSMRVVMPFVRSVTISSR